MNSEASLLCLTAQNPSPYTAQGTNSYLLFGPTGDAVLIDAGPDLPSHQTAIQAALGGAKLQAILLTHAHADHAGGALALSRGLGAPIYGFGPGLGPSNAGGEDMVHLTPDFVLLDGMQLALAGMEITVLHTPGHTPDHACFALGDMLFSGDHVMGWASTLVAPPQGDMAKYRASLHKLLALPHAQYLPGHGPPIAQPQDRLRALIAHRADREAQIIAALQQGPANALSLSRRIYIDTPAALMPAAAQNTLAHLIEICAKGRVTGPHIINLDAVFTAVNQGHENT